MSQTSKPYSSAQTFIRPTQTDQAQGIAQCSAGRLTQISAEPALELLRLRKTALSKEVVREAAASTSIDTK